MSIIKNRTYNHIGLLLTLMPNNILSLLKIIEPIKELYIANGNFEGKWIPQFHIKGNVDKKSLIIIKDLAKKEIINYYTEKDNSYIVVSIPNEYHSVVYYWLRGEYSKMLSKELQKKLLNKNRVDKFRAYNKIGDYKSVFISYIKSSFNMTDNEIHHINIDNLEECDIPPLIKEEVLNFNIELKKEIINWHDEFKNNLKSHEKN